MISKKALKRYIDKRVRQSFIDAHTPIQFTNFYHIIKKTDDPRRQSMLIRLFDINGFGRIIDKLK